MKTIKYILLVGLLCFVALNAEAQKISLKEDDGVHMMIGTELMEITIQSTNKAADNYLAPALYLAIDKKTKKEQYTVLFSLKPNHIFTFDKNSHLYIQTIKGNIITLTNRVSIEDVLYTYDFFSGSFVEPMYNISSQDLNLIMKEGISVLRFESTAGIIDFISTQNLVAQAIKEEFELIRSVIDFDSNF